MSELQLFEYKNYAGSIEISIEDGCLFGKVLYIKDVVFYSADTIPELEIAFKSAVDEYLLDCELLGKDPNKPFSGTFNVRIGSENHRKLSLYAQRHGINLNSAVNNAVDLLLKKNEILVSSGVYISGKISQPIRTASKEQWKGLRLVDDRKRTIKK